MWLCVFPGEAGVPCRVDEVRDVPGEVGLQAEVRGMPPDGRGIQRVHEGEDGHGDAAFRVPRPRQSPPVRQARKQLT